MSEHKFYHEVQGTVCRTLRYNCEEASWEGDKTISQMWKVPKNTVSSFSRKWKEYGTTQTPPRADRPTKLSNWARRTLVREVTKNPMTTLTELQSSLVEMGEPARKTPISVALHKSRLYGSGQTEATLEKKAHDSTPGVGKKAHERLRA